MACGYVNSRNRRGLCILEGKKYIYMYPNYLNSVYIVIYIFFEGVLFAKLSITPRIANNIRIRIILKSTRYISL